MRTVARSVGCPPTGFCYCLIFHSSENVLLISCHLLLEGLCYKVQTRSHNPSDRNVTLWITCRRHVVMLQVKCLTKK